MASLCTVGRRINTIVNVRDSPLSGSDSYKYAPICIRTSLRISHLYWYADRPRDTIAFQSRRPQVPSPFHSALAHPYELPKSCGPGAAPTLSYR